MVHGLSLLSGRKIVKKRAQKISFELPHLKQPNELNSQK